MKLSCTQENLNQGLLIVSHIASRSSSLPILGNVLITGAKNTITLSATNLEIGVTCIVRGTIEQEGAFTVYSRLLAEYINLLPKERVDITAPQSGDVDQVLGVVCKKNKTTIKGQQAADFPLIPEIDKKNPYTVEYKTFRQALSQVVFSAATSEIRPEIMGVLFSFSKDTLTLAATDSYRLAEKKIPIITGSASADQQVIVPAKTVQELQRVIGGSKDGAALAEVSSIQIYVADSQILFTFGGVELVSRLIEGQYPDYTQIIPERGGTVLSALTVEVVTAVKAASLFARSGIFDISLSFEPENGELVVSSGNTQLGENTSHVSGSVSGDANTTNLNFRYLLDGLQNVNSDQVEVSIIDSASPVLVRPVGDESYRYIVMPIKQ